MGNGPMAAGVKHQGLGNRLKHKGGHRKKVSTHQVGVNVTQGFPASGKGKRRGRA